MSEANKVEVLVRYRKTNSTEVLNSFIEGDDYESVLRTFLKVKGGRSNISIISIQDWDRRKKHFTIPEPITIEDKDNVIFKIMNE